MPTNQNSVGWGGKKETPKSMKCTWQQFWKRMKRFNTFSDTEEWQYNLNVHFKKTQKEQ